MKKAVGESKDKVEKKSPKGQEPPKPKKKALDEDEEEVYEPDFEGLGGRSKKKQQRESMQRRAVAAALMAQLKFQPE